jgi:hypothetical protein
VLSLNADGSGENGTGAFVLGGYLAHTPDLFELECLWCAELKKPPSIEYFKASECVRRGPNKEFGKQFVGWPDAAVAEKRYLLAEIVNRCGPRLVEVSSSVQWDEYRSAVDGSLTGRIYYHPYIVCFHGLLSLAIEKANVHFDDYDGRIAIVLDEESYKNINADIKTHYDVVSNTLPPEVRSRLGSLTIADDKLFPLLQPPDLIAGSIRSDREKFPSPVLDVLRNNLAGGYERPFRGSGLARVVTDIDTELRKRWPDTKPEDLDL